jgi:hypothetical protein
MEGLIRTIIGGQLDRDNTTYLCSPGEPRSVPSFCIRGRGVLGTQNIIIFCCFKAKVNRSNGLVVIVNPIVLDRSIASREGFPYNGGSG